MEKPLFQKDRGKDLVESKPRQLPATIKPANKAVAIRKTFDIKPNVKNSKIEEITKGATSRAERMSRLRKAGLLAAGGATVAAIGVGTGGKKHQLQQQAQIKVIKNLEHLKQRQPPKLLVRKEG